MDVSNRTLAVLLIAAIVFSVGGTLMSFNQITAPGTTGYATNNQTGTIDLNVQDSLSIILQDSVIDFGNCEVNSSRVAYYDSSLGSSGADNHLCTGGTFPDNITIENNGNIDANLSVSIDVNGSTLFSNANSAIAYFATNVTGREGCAANGQLVTTRTNFTAVGSSNDYDICHNMTFSDTNDRIAFFAYIQLDPSSTSGGTATVTFEAKVIG